MKFFHILQIFGLHDTFWPLKSLAFICPDHFELEVLQKAPKDITRALLEIKTTLRAKRSFQLLVRPF